MTQFIKGTIDNVIIRELVPHEDDRGWLTEIYRQDGLDRELLPVMTYLSLTRPGVVRGPHEHIHQTDLFCFTGISTFKVYLWDNRKESRTFLHKMEVEMAEDHPMLLIVPPGIVHCYKNIGGKDGFVINLPNKLYGGTGKKEKVDEVRHEDDFDSLFEIK